MTTDKLFAEKQLSPILSGRLLTSLGNVLVFFSKEDRLTN